MKLCSLQDLFLAGVREMYDCERRLAEALPRLAEQAASPDLKRLLNEQRVETQERMTRLETVCARLGTTPHGWECMAMPTLLDGDGHVEVDGGPGLQDAVLVATCQKIAHFMLAAYRSAGSRARHLGHGDAADLLRQSQDEEERADERLTALGETFHTQAARLPGTSGPAVPRAA